MLIFAAWDLILIIFFCAGSKPLNFLEQLLRVQIQDFMYMQRKAQDLSRGNDKP